MHQSQYILQRYTGQKSRHKCPRCGQNRQLSRYVDQNTGQELADHIGRCNRSDQCGYHVTPKQFFEANGQKPVRSHFAPPQVKTKEAFSTPLHLMERSMGNYGRNNFALGLLLLFGEENTTELLTKYACIGTSIKYPGSVIFWQITQNGEVRAGKIINYTSKTLKRVKDSTKWTHGHAGNIPTHQELKQCFFGQNLLIDHNKIVAVVESEKTAIICAHFYPKYTWLAAGSLDGLTETKMQALKGCKVILFPDLGAGYQKWVVKAKEYRYITDITVSDFLEKEATPEQRNAGFDLADFLIEEKKAEITSAVVQQGMGFCTPTPVTPIKNGLYLTSSRLSNSRIIATKSTPMTEEKVVQSLGIDPITGVSPIWANEVLELDAFFNQVTLPTVPVKLDKVTTVTDVAKMIFTHLSILTNNTHYPTFSPTLKRLRTLKTIIQSAEAIDTAQNTTTPISKL